MQRETASSHPKPPGSLSQDELLEEAYRQLERVGTTGCGCEDTGWLRRNQKWLAEYAYHLKHREIGFYMARYSLPRLYVWRPNGHGQRSVILMADGDVDAATARANDAVKAALELMEDQVGDGESYHVYTEYDFRDWGTDYYELTVLDMNSILFHEND